MSQDEYSMPTAQQEEMTRYAAECPTCGEWHEFDEESSGNVVDCIFGTDFRVVK